MLLENQNMDILIFFSFLCSIISLLLKHLCLLDLFVLFCILICLLSISSMLCYNQCLPALCCLSNINFLINLSFDFFKFIFIY